MVKILKFKGWKLFTTLTILFALFAYVDNTVFLTDNLYYNTFGEQFAIYRIDEAPEFLKKWEWVNYAVIPFIILLRVLYTTVFLYIGVFFTQLKVAFGKIFTVALLADFVYVIASVVKLIILIFFKEVSKLEDLEIEPFSVLKFLNKESIDPLFVFPLGLLNLFELCYFLVLALILVPALNETNLEQPIRFGKSLKLVTVSYGSGLLLWIVLVMILTLNGV